MKGTDDQAYVAFVQAAWERHLRLAILLTGDRLRGEELLQDSLVKMYERWRKLSRHDDLHAYLRRTLVNNHVSIWRRIRREDLVSEIPDRPATPSGRHPEAEVLRRALLRLPRRQRAVVVLRHYEDLSERAVADAMGCSIGTVKTQNARGLQRLREILRGSIPQHVLREARK